MNELIDDTADYVLDLASSQRLSILFKLLEKKSTPTELAKKLDSTKQEVHRNFTRLMESGLIKKNNDGKYSLTTFGEVVCTQVPTLVFLSQSRKYFEENSFGDIPNKFKMRAVSLQTEPTSRDSPESWSSGSQSTKMPTHTSMRYCPRSH